MAIVNADQITTTREALTHFYGGSPLHAAPMFRRAELATLRQATQLVARQNDAMDIVVCAPIRHGESRDTSRARCLSHAALKAQAEWGTTLFVLDSLSTPTENSFDKRTFHDLRKASDGRLSRNAVAIHCRPSQELLLGLPDILAWPYRQERVGRSIEWFEPLRDCTEVTVL